MKTGILTKIINEKLTFKEYDKRDYIGASNIGSDCLRQIWYEYNGYGGEKIPNKLKITFEIDKSLEGMIKNILALSCFEIYFWGYEVKDESLPYFKGNVDCAIKDDGKIKTVLVIKTANDAQFKLFVKHGLLKWNKKYYSQVQSYMGMSGIDSSFLIALNKDTSEFHDEYVEFDQDYYDDLKEKAMYVHDSKSPPKRVNDSPLWFQCKSCKFRRICHD